jgi:hypothetical protein
MGVEIRRNKLNSDIYPFYVGCVYPEDDLVFEFRIFSLFQSRSRIVHFNVDRLDELVHWSPGPRISHPHSLFPIQKLCHEIISECY